MLIDTHCHIDLYKNAREILQNCEISGITVLAMTNLPSHFEMGYNHVLPFKRVRLALGMHPLYAEHHKKEFPLFLKNLSKTSYIGEVGLDFSKEGLKSKDVQLESFELILNSIRDKKKILSIHSRRAEREVFQLLMGKQIKNAVFHWYSGPQALIDEISGAGYYFSVNPAMIKTESGRQIILRIPPSKMLTETDGPFTEIDGREAHPIDIYLVYQHLSLIWNMPLESVHSLISTNFKNLVSYIK